MTETETWYVMGDGSLGDPRDISVGKDGKLHHKDGRAVAYGPYGPRSRGCVDPKAQAKARPQAAIKAPESKTDPDARVKEATKSIVEPQRSDREVKADDGKATYKTR